MTINGVNLITQVNSVCYRRISTGSTEKKLLLASVEVKYAYQYKNKLTGSREIFDPFFIHLLEISGGKAITECTVERDKNGTINGYKGYCYEIIHALQKLYNFRFVSITILCLFIS